jgi:hypothetical protein
LVMADRDKPPKRDDPFVSDPVPPYPAHAAAAAQEEQEDETTLNIAEVIQRMQKQMEGLQQSIKQQAEMGRVPIEGAVQFPGYRLSELGDLKLPQYLQNTAAPISPTMQTVHAWLSLEGARASHVQLETALKQPVVQPIPELSVPEQMQGAEASKPKIIRSHLRTWIIEVWIYSSGLAIILGAVVSVLSGSIRLLEPIIAVCVASGVVGTVMALLRSAQEEQNASEDQRNFGRSIFR